MPSEGTDAVEEPAGFLAYLKALGRAPGTLENKTCHLAVFFSFLGGQDIQSVTPSMMDGYKTHLLKRINRRTGKLSGPARARELFYSARQYLAYLVRRKRIPANPAEIMFLHRREERLPRRIPTEEEVDRLLSSPSASTPRGLRARAILELIYSTGLRRREVLRLNVVDVDFRRGTVMVRQGKGRKDRMVPLGRRAQAAAAAYMAVRPRHDKRGDKALFITVTGGRIGPEGLSALVKRYARRADVEATCYGLRHAFATHMMRGGAEVRRLQEMLGHASLESTKVYTRLTIQDLKDAHRKHHPRGKVKLKGQTSPKKVG